MYLGTRLTTRERVRGSTVFGFIGLIFSYLCGAATSIMFITCSKSSTSGRCSHPCTFAKAQGSSFDILNQCTIVNTQDPYFDILNLICRFKDKSPSHHMWTSYFLFAFQNHQTHIKCVCLGLLRAMQDFLFQKTLTIPYIF